MATEQTRQKDRWKVAPEAMGLVAERFRALAKPIRLRILCELQQRALSVAEVTVAVGSTQPNVSKHLKLLSECGILGRRQEGNTVLYWIEDASVLSLCQLVAGSLRAHLQSQAKKLLIR